MDSIRLKQPEIMYIGLVAVLLFTAWMGARGLDADPLWSDELISIGHVGGLEESYDPVATWEAVQTRSRAHSPGYFLLLGAWGSFVGWSPVALRSLSLLIGLLGVAWTYRLGRDVVSPRVGFYAAVIMATSAFFTYYLHELRMYALNATSVAYALWMYHRVLTRHTAPRWFEWVGLFGGALILLYTHHFSAIVLGAIGLYHGTGGFARFVVGTSHRDRRRWVMIGGVFALAGVCFLPWFDNAINGLDAPHNASPSLAETSLTSGELLRATLDRFGNGSAVLASGVLMLALIFTVRDRRRAVYIWSMAVLLLAAIVIVNLAQQVIPMRRLRYLLVLWPLLAVLAGTGLAAVSVARRWLPVPLLLAWAIFGINASLGRDVVIDQGGAAPVFPLHVLADTVEPMIQPDDVLVGFGDLATHWGTNYMQVPDYYLRDLTSTYFYFDNQFIPTLDPLLAITPDHARVWVAYQTTNRTPHVIEYEQALSATHRRCATFDASQHLRVDRYVKHAQTCD